MRLPVRVTKRLWQGDIEEPANLSIRMDDDDEDMRRPAISAAMDAPVVPEVVKQFVSYFHRHIKGASVTVSPFLLLTALLDGNVVDINSMYENSFNKITEKYFKNIPWP